MYSTVCNNCTQSSAIQHSTGKLVFAHYLLPSNWYFQAVGPSIKIVAEWVRFLKSYNIIQTRTAATFQCCLSVHYVVHNPNAILYITRICTTDRSSVSTVTVQIRKITFTEFHNTVCVSVCVSISCSVGVGMEMRSACEIFSVCVFATFVSCSIVSVHSVHKHHHPRSKSACDVHGCTFSCAERRAIDRSASLV